MLELIVRAFTQTGTLLRYAIGGGLGAITQFSVLTFLIEIHHVNPTAASAAGFILAVIVNYTFQYQITFKADKAHTVLFRRFTTVALCGLAINTALFWVFNEKMGIYYLIAQVGATGIVFLFNYLMNFYYTFNHGEQ
jgi:putative flippase GtrA